MSKNDGKVPREAPKLGQILIHRGHITQEQLTEALGIQARTRELLGRILIRMGVVSERDVCEAVACQFKVRFVDLTVEPIDRRCLRLVPEHLARRHQVVPVRQEGQTLVLAMADVTDVLILDDLHVLTGLQIQAALATLTDVRQVLDTLYPRARVEHPEG